MTPYQKYLKAYKLYYSDKNWENRHEIFSLLHEAYSLGCGKAASLLGHIYSDMEITEVDDKESKKWFHNAYLLEDGEGLYQEAYQYLFNYDNDTYFNLIKRSAEKHYPMGMYVYALLLLNMHPFESIEWLKRCSKAKYQDANNLLADFYRYGKYYQDVDLKLSAKYLLKNEKPLYYLSVFKLGQYYDFGIGIRKNYKKARYYYQIANEECYNYQANGFIARHYIYGLGGLKVDKEKGFNLLIDSYHKCLEDKDVISPILYYELYRCYLKGIGTKKDKKEASKFLKLWQINTEIINHHGY